MVSECWLCTGGRVGGFGSGPPACETPGNIFFGFPEGVPGPTPTKRGGRTFPSHCFDFEGFSCVQRTVSKLDFMCFGSPDEEKK